MSRSRMRRRIGVLLATMLAVAVPVVWISTASSRSEPAPVARGHRVLLVGDSLLWQSVTPVTTTLTADGWEPTVQAAPATTIGDWSSKVAGLVAETHPDVVAVELGTNNCTETCPHLAAVIDAFLRQIPRTTPVIWLNVQAQPTYPAHPESVNDALAAAASRWSNVSLADMSARFRNHPDWHVADGIHFSAAGSEQLGTLIAEVLRSVR